MMMDEDERLEPIDEFENENDSPPAVSLDTLDGAVSIMPSGGGGGGDGGPGSKWAYSAILRDQADFHCDAIFDFLRDYSPEGDFAKLVINRLANIVNELLKAPGSYRMLQYDQAKERSERWKADISGKDKAAQLEKVDLWLQRWGRASAMITSIRRKRLQQGLESVQNRDDKLHYYTALLQQRDIRRLVVLELQPDALQYFNARLEMFLIQEKFDEERAMGFVANDYSNLIRDVSKGVQRVGLGRLIAELPDFFGRIFTWSIGHTDRDNPYRDWMQDMIAGVGTKGNTAGRGMNGYRRRGGSRGGDDDDGGGYGSE